MFQNSYQNGTFFQVFDAKWTAQKLKPIYRCTNTPANNKIFDKQLKTYVLQFLSNNAKLNLPRQQKKDLYLIQQYLVIQIYIYPGLSWGIELVISDLTKTKRRVILSPTTQKAQVKPFFVKSPCRGYKQGSWNNFVVDLYSYMDVFKGQTYRSLDAIYITGHFKLRRIYTSATQPIQMEGQNQSQQIKQINFLPKNFYFPLGIQYATRINRYDPQQCQYEPTEPSTKNSSFLKPKISKPTLPQKQETKIFKNDVKTQKNISNFTQEGQNKKIKDFLSNTNGQLISRVRRQQKSQSQSSQVRIDPKTSKTTQKYGKKKNLIKTQQVPPKARSSLQKNSLKQQKNKIKQKVNPWRTDNKQQTHTDISHIAPDRQSQTPQTLTLFNKQPQLSQTKGLRFQGKSQHYSDSQYVELSQKFSTLTDGKFYRQQKTPYHELQKIQATEDPDEIEQNIEMQTNSMYSNSNRKKQQQPINIQINQSICDSLDKPTPQKDLARSSLYGFGQKLMKNLMHEMERPYSPPLGQRQVTEQDVSEHPQDQKYVDLIYDPVLNCYYNYKTHTYYQLKN